MALTLETKAEIASQILKDRDELDSLRSQLFGARHELSVQKDKYETMKRSLVKIEVEKRAMQQQNDELLNQVADTKTELGRQRRVIAELQGNQQEALTAKNDLLDKYRQLATEKAAEVRKTEAQAQRCVNAENSVAQLTEERADLRGELERKDKHLRELTVTQDITAHELAASQERVQLLSANVHRDFESIAGALTHLVGVASVEMERAALHAPSGTSATEAGATPSRRIPSDAYAGINVSSMATTTPPPRALAGGTSPDATAPSIELTETSAEVATAATVQLQLSKLGTLVGELRIANLQAFRIAIAHRDERKKLEADLQGSLAENAKLSSRLSVAETKGGRHEQDSARAQQELGDYRDVNLKLLADLADVLQCAPTAESLLSQANRVTSDNATLQERVVEQQEQLGSLRRESAKQKSDHTRHLEASNKRAHDDLNDVSRTAHHEISQQNASLVDSNIERRRVEGELETASTQLHTVSKRYDESVAYASDLERKNVQLRAELESALAVNERLRSEKSAYERVVDGRRGQAAQSTSVTTLAQTSFSSSPSPSVMSNLENAFFTLLHASYGMSLDIKELCQQRRALVRYCTQLDAALLHVEDSVRYCCLAKRPGVLLRGQSSSSSSSSHQRQLAPCMKLRRCAIVVMAARRLKALARRKEMHVFKATPVVTGSSSSQSPSSSIYPRVRMPPLEKQIDASTFLFPSLLDRSLCSVVHNMINQVESDAVKKQRSSFGRHAALLGSLSSKLGAGLQCHAVSCGVAIDPDNRAALITDLVSKHLVGPTTNATEQQQPQRSGIATTSPSRPQHGNVSSSSSSFGAPRTEIPANYPTFYSRRGAPSTNTSNMSVLQQHHDTSGMLPSRLITSSIKPTTPYHQSSASSTLSSTGGRGGVPGAGSATRGAPSSGTHANANSNNKTVTFSAVSPLASSCLVSPSRRDASASTPPPAALSQPVDISNDVLNVIRALDERVSGALHRSKGPA